MTNSHWLDDLDAAWDGIASGAPAGDALDLETQRLLGDLHHLQARADAPLAGRRRTWNPPTRSRRRFHPHAPRFSAIHAYTLVALLLLASMAGAYSTTRDHGSEVSQSTPIPAEGGPRLYLIDGGDAAWGRIDPHTLNEVPGQSGAGIVFSPPDENKYSGQIAMVSDDGSTVLAVLSKIDSTGDGEATFQFYDAATSRLRSSLPLGATDGFNASSLSAHGDQFVLYKMTNSTHSDSIGQFVSGLSAYDTNTGRLIRQLDLTSPDSEVVGLPVIDAEGVTAYVMTVNNANQAHDPGSVDLATYDLKTGSAMYNTTLENMIRLADASPGKGSPPYQSRYASALMTLSDDGQTLAVESFDLGHLALFDTRTHQAATKPITTTNGGPCIQPEGSAYSWFLTVFKSNRIVTPVWTQGSDFSDEFYMTGMCSTDIATGRATFKPSAEMLPSGWFAVTPFLSSDGASLYVAGVLTPKNAATATSARAVNQFGIFAFDAMTLTLKAQRLLPLPDPNSGHGFLFSETPLK